MLISSPFKMSVIMPTWNREGIIGRAIDSILKQTYKNIELIIVDDGSSDGTETLLRNSYLSIELPDGMKIEYIKIPKSGVSKARNIGLKAAHGSLIAYLDSDNEWSPFFAEKMITKFQTNPNCQCAYSALETKKVKDIGNFSLFKEFNRVDLLYQNYIDMNTFVHSRALYENLGGFSDELKRLVDWDLILRFTAENPPLQIKEILVNYYVNQTYNHITHSVDLRPNLLRILESNFKEIQNSPIPSLLSEKIPSVWYSTLAQPEWHITWLDVWREILQKQGNKQYVQ